MPRWSTGEQASDAVNMISECEIVKLKRPIAGLNTGAIGTIVGAYDSIPPGYEVEFADRNGMTLELLTLQDEDLEPVAAEQ
jgi:hypothetical protein